VAALPEPGSTGAWRTILVGDDGKLIPTAPYIRVVRFVLRLPSLLRLPDNFTRTITRPLTIEERVAVQQRFPDYPVSGELVCSLRFMRVETLHDGGMTATEVTALRRCLPGFEASGFESDRPSAPSAETFVEAFGVLPDTDGGLSDLFDSVLASIRGLQRSYDLAFPGAVVAPISRAVVPPMILAFVHGLDDPPEGWHQNPSAFLTHWPIDAGSAHSPVLTHEQVDRLEGIHEALSGDDPFVRAAVLRAEAVLLLERFGDTRGAVLASATACELLLNDLLVCLCWEEGMTPEEGASVFDKTLVSRVKRGEYSSRLGGDWGLDGTSAVARWFDAVACVRNLVIHGGTEPDEARAREAIGAFAALVEFIARRLTQRAGRYPRTMWRYLGRENTSEQLRLRHVQPLLDDPSETLWSETISRWRFQMYSWTDEGRDLLPEPDPSAAELSLVLHPDGRCVWVLYDRRAGRATVADPPEDRLVVERASELQRQLGHVDNPCSLFLAHSTAAPTTAEWILPYRLLPLGPVMVTGEQLD
jgi:hypothetical protein